MDSGLGVETIAVLVYTTPTDHPTCTSNDTACHICQPINDPPIVHVKVCQLTVGVGTHEFGMYIIPAGSVSEIVYHVAIHDQIFVGVRVKRTIHHIDTFGRFDVFEIIRSARAGVHVFVSKSHVGLKGLVHCEFALHSTHLFEPVFTHRQIGFELIHLLLDDVFAGPHSTQIH